MRKKFLIEKSAGGIIFFEDKTTKVLYVAALKKENRRYFPKGHVEKKESSYDAAIREIDEEISLKKIQLIGRLGSTGYSFKDTRKRTINKTVEYFVFQSKKMYQLVPQTAEGYDEASWVEFNQALATIHFDNDKDMLLKARQYYLPLVQALYQS